MPRLLLIALLVLAVAYVAFRLTRNLRGTEIDWRGIGVAAAFVALAVYLSQVAGIGGVAG
ncbi:MULTISPECIES: hypothetical protein [unclassified Aminobacter]|uniref:hypothetical protein n=1 Tax=unclassified Aminobacter TaxID=2644704 RepID=UPI0004674D74|nr:MULTISPECIES: hypothetical protein [unclassified Aminobacter]TWH36527.1 hypothetical protein L611_000100000090 [Aminobacter sp. J15]